MKSDIIIIGAGPGGYETALDAASRGKSVILIERSSLGGTCLNRGCIPTKALCHNAEILQNLKSASAYGINVGEIRTDFKAMMARKDAIVTQLREGINSMLNSAHIDVVEGDAKILSPHSVECNGNIYNCDNLIIATGSKPKFLNIEGAHLGGVLTSDEALSMEALPKSMCIIGGGVIGIEFASIFSSLGVAVTVVEFCKEILPNFDTEIAKRMRQLLSRQGIKLLVGAAVQKIAETERGTVTVEYIAKEKSSIVEADVALMSVGRAAELPEGVENAGVEISRNCIVVDDAMCACRQEGVYAIGDVNGRCMLAHAASFQGRRALNAICGVADKIRFDIIPAAVFTSPEMAMVGMTEDECSKREIPTIVKKSFFRANGKAVAMGEVEGLLKIIVREDTREIVGCHIMGAHASDLIQEVTALMNERATIDDYKSIIHSHPTLSETLQTAVMQF